MFPETPEHICFPEPPHQPWWRAPLSILARGLNVATAIHPRGCMCRGGDGFPVMLVSSGASVRIMRGPRTGLRSNVSRRGLPPPSRDMLGFHDTQEIGIQSLSNIFKIDHSPGGVGVIRGLRPHDADRLCRSMYFHRIRTPRTMTFPVSGQERIVSCLRLYFIGTLVDASIK